MYIKRNQATTVAEVVELNTGIKAEEFIKPCKLPFIKNIKEAVQMIKEAKENNIPIHIIGDYDCDGVFATAILYNGLKQFGLTASTRLPRRFSEGYGLSTKIIDEINDGLVITVDNGIATHEAIKKAKEKGLKVIVTDHHLGVTDDNGNIILPDADLIVDAHVDNESEFKDYCGAMIAYRLVSELLGKDDRDLLTMASIATVCDVMPLVGPNRDVVRAGLMTINKGAGGPGLRTLLSKLRLENIDEDNYGYGIGPCINASGRLYDNGAEKALNLFKATGNNPTIPFMADTLVKNNEKRKETVKKDMIIAEKKVSKRPIVMYDKEFGEGIIGIIAGNLCEKYACPTIVFTDSSKKGILKGSGRSIEGIHLKSVLDSINDLIVRYGGHAGAAGLSIKEKDLDKFTKAFEEAVGELPELTDDVFYDLELDVNNASNELKELTKYAPFGEANPKPIYHGIFEATENYRVIGDGTHFILKCGNITLLGFGLKEKYESLKKDNEYPRKLEAIGYLTKSIFNGKEQIKFQLIDFKEYNDK